MPKMRCKIRSGARRAIAKDKANSLEDSILRRGSRSSQGRDNYKFCGTDEEASQHVSTRAPRFTSWRRS